MNRITRPKLEINRITWLILGAGIIAFFIFCRLFYLQIIQHSHYQAIAQESQYGFIELPAQRGRIIISDHHSGEEFPVATNTTLNLLYADPALIQDPTFITTEIGPLLFDLEEARLADNERIEKLRRTIAAELTPEELTEAIRPLSDKELEDAFLQDFEAKISSKQRSEVLIVEDLSNAESSRISRLKLDGIAVLEGDVYAYPQDIKNRKYTADALAPLLDIPPSRLEQILKGETRYVVLKRKLDPDISDQIQAKFQEEARRPKKNKDDLSRFHGLGMQEEYYRFYPEEVLAASIVGFTDKAGEGQYGIERSLNAELKGIKGRLQTKQDALNRQLTVGDSKIEQAVDGADVLLTIDRSIQLKLEEELRKGVINYQADSGQAVIMDPYTGAILAMANYPDFNPNAYGDVYKTVEINLTQEEIEQLVETKQEDVFYFYTNPITLARYLVFREKFDDGSEHYFRYENFVGPEVYQNKTVSLPYEPGSVFKSIAMAAAIDDGEITPDTLYQDDGPVGVDWRPDLGRFEFEIKNAETNYMGLVDMNTVLAYSLNTGMTFIAKKMGPALYYNYLERFGFMEPTYVGFDSEISGQVEYFEGWSESELATKAFGQGITVNMVQLATAYSAIANGGILVKPYIIDEIRFDDGTVTKTEPRQIRRVISEETSRTMGEMLTFGVDTAAAKNAQVAGYSIAGKTGTAQTYRNGKALSGRGTTLASFAGYAPTYEPKFVMIVKYDHPRTVEWGSATAAFTFQKVTDYLLDYYNAMPDKATESTENNE